MHKLIAGKYQLATAFVTDPFDHKTLISVFTFVTRRSLLASFTAGVVGDLGS